MKVELTPWFTRDCYGAPVPLHDFAAYRQAHPCSFILAASAMKSLERGENLVDELFIETDTIILDNDLEVPSVPRDTQLGGILSFHHRLLNNQLMADLGQYVK
jgi:hypothetical protein